MLKTFINSTIQNPKFKIDITPSLSSPLKLLSFGQSLCQRLFSISPESATFDQRGFQVSDTKAQAQLEKIGKIFLQGYHAAMSNDKPLCIYVQETTPKVIDQPENLILQLNKVETEYRGFAFEGAGMGLALLDGLTPWKRNRVQDFLTSGGKDHAYMVHVGVGWALARLPWSVQKSLAKLDSLLGWLAIDGYGFHQGYFHWRDYVNSFAIPKKLSGYALRVFDQGLGRSIWFVKGADVTLIRHTIQSFPLSRQADLWSGIGLACTYAGGVDGTAVETLRIAASDYIPELAQGAAFAAQARSKAGNPTAHTEMACQILCGMSAEAAAEITDVALKNLSPTCSEMILPAYEVWRQRIQAQFVAMGVGG